LTWLEEEQRFVEHLKFIGYTTEATTDPNGWHFSTNPIAPAVGFRAGPHFLCLHADYPAGHHDVLVYGGLLREVNRLNAALWLVRCTLIKHDRGAGATLSIRLQANLPLNLPAEELGACVLAWIRESTHIERAAQLRARASEGTNTEDDRSNNVIDDHPTRTT